jgi:hypothetical protein
MASLQPKILAGLVIAAAGNLVAILIDWLVLRRQMSPSGWSVPGDFQIFRGGALAIFGHSTMVGQLMYPPPFLLLIAPFTVLPPEAGDLLWGLAGMLVLALATRRIGLRCSQICLGLLSPPVLYCVTMGQSGLFVSAALLLALALADEAPVLAGIAAGCVIIKPQFGLLLPICLIAARQWRAVAAAAVTVGVLCALPALLFGPWVWKLFYSAQLGAARGVVANPGTFPEHMMITPFILFRALGMTAHGAGLFQAMASLLAIAACWSIWSRGDESAQTVDRLAVTSCLVALVTPYGYVYDLPVLAVALLAYGAKQRPGWLAAVAIFWGATGAYGLISTFILPAGALLMIALLLAVWPTRIRAR